MNGFGDTQTPLQALDNFAEGFLGVKPIFSGGVQIGNWSPGGGLVGWFNTNAASVMSDLCNAQVSLNDGLTAAQLDPSTWMTYNDWDALVKVQDYCLQKAVIPSWLSSADLSQYQQNADGSITPQSQTSSLIPIAIGGGLVLISILLLARR